MKKKYILILKDKVKRKNFLKTELKKLILKSILQNFKIKSIIRLDASRQLTFFKTKSSISKQNNMCLLTGRMGGIFKKWQISRHSMKSMAKFNSLHNVKIHSW